jgi:D-alanyl-D-alanine carboxypeptidase
MHSTSPTRSAARGFLPDLNVDPGRVCYEPFFAKMYGDCTKGEVEGKLVDAVWLLKHGGKHLRITRVNGVADRLKAISDERDTLPDGCSKYLTPSGGTYNCRVIQGTNRRSVHGNWAAIDINVAWSDYWLNNKPVGGKYRYKNRIPWDIVEIFEKNGFIWGGKWYHYDTMHFEYRPELLP